ncbi:hypothetical protein BBJ28_00019203 [Nothophytophthora sp. Chile5]|nr:hypothetical protein BBJ28_00019203 [Nothophytophthora sp. Chile5]
MDWKAASDGAADGASAAQAASPPAVLPSTASLPVSSALVASSASAPPSMSMFYGMERDDFGARGAANTALSIIEEGDDHDLGAEAFADMAMGGMDMGMELSTLQIRAFLTRSEQQGGFAAPSTVVPAPPPPPKDHENSNNAVLVQRERTKQAKTTESAYEMLKNGAVHYSRREDKMRALRAHPVVASVASDGRTVGCKCGRNVRLNPPWYVLKFEQHVASRNCTFLRQSRPTSKKKRKTKEGATTKTLSPASAKRITTEVTENSRPVADAVQVGSGGSKGSVACEAVSGVSRDDGSSMQQLENASGEAREPDVETVDPLVPDQIQGQNRQNQVAADKTEGEGEDVNDGADPNEYGLQSMDQILRREFGVMEGGQRKVVAPPANSPEERIQMYEAAMTLRGNAHFSRITPDGRFVECKCLRLVLLAAPWQPGLFLQHVADKKKAKKRARSSTTVVNESHWRKKKLATASMPPSAAAIAMVSSGVIQRPIGSAAALMHLQKKKKSFPREIRWDVARARGLLPCPGLRDERMNMFVASAIQLTGGARPRRKIAQELFPHLFPNNWAYDHNRGVIEGLEHQRDRIAAEKRPPKLQQQLLEAEKLLLHDVIEAEALWFVDKDGSSVRSLECRGIFSAAKGEVRCASCAGLRRNAALWSAATATQKKAIGPGPPPNPVNRKFCSGSVCSLLEAEFDMREPHGRLLRDLALVNIPDGSTLNTWMAMAAMGLAGAFDTHPALLGLAEAMVRLKDKEQRGVGLQNMTYSAHLDAFMRALADLSLEACELFQRHLGGRKQRQLLAATSTLAVSSRRKLQPPASSSTASKATHDQQTNDLLYDAAASSEAAVARVSSEDGFAHLLDPSVVGLTMPHLSIGDIQDVDLSGFPTTGGAQHQLQPLPHDREGGVDFIQPPTSSTSATGAFPQSLDRGHAHQEPEKDINGGDSVVATMHEQSESEPQATTDGQDEDEGEAREEGEVQMESDPGAVAFLTDLTAGEVIANSKTASNGAVAMPSDHVPCTGLRDENVQSYVANAVQLVGGSRPRYVIARELYHRLFSGDEKVRMVDKLNDEQRLMLQDAVFSECLWRVDKEGRCVRSLRCTRFVAIADRDEPVSLQNQGVCRACRDLRTVPNFRSMLSRSKVPKKLENVKYVPSVYTESDPFLRKLSKNAAFRGLYQIVRRLTSSESSGDSEVDASRRKHVTFWLRFARMGVFGQFQSHPVFEGLMESMVEVKDKERRGVGKQNMQYSQALDDFMHALAQLSTEAFELFATQFCGRTLRSQKVKRRRTSPATPTFNTPMQATVTSSLHRDEVVESEPSVDDGNSAEASGAHQSLPPSVLLPPHQHYLMPPEDLLSGRGMSSEESQRFMDRMLDEVRLSVSREIELTEAENRHRSIGDVNEVVAGTAEHESDPNGDEDERDGSSHLDPETYLNDDGVLTTEI